MARASAAAIALLAIFLGTYMAAAAAAAAEARPGAAYRRALLSANTAPAPGSGLLTNAAAPRAVPPPVAPAAAPASATRRGTVTMVENRGSTEWFWPSTLAWLQGQHMLGRR